MQQPIEAPLPCFGIHQTSENKKCASCAHKAGCAVAMGTRFGRVAVDKVSFDLLPAGMRRPGDTSERDLQEIYQTSYRSVFGQSPNHSVGLVAGRVIANAARAHVNLAMYVLCNMCGWALTWPEQEFTPACLVDNRALNRVRVYSAAAREQYGVFDVHTLSNVTGINVQIYDLQEIMYRTEVKAGRWIIDWKLRNDGPPYTALFDEIETELDPAWLAIEPRYTPRLLEFVRKPTTEHQHRVADTFIKLKKRSHEARGHFCARERALPLAIQEVLSQIGYTASAFETKPEAVRDALLYWHRLAQTVQHLEVMKYVQDGVGFYA